MLRSAPTHESPGSMSRRSSVRLPIESLTKALRPVMLPPGRERLATARRGSPIAAMTTGMVLVAFLAANAAGVPARRNQIDVLTDKLLRKLREAIGVAIYRAVFDLEIPPFNIAKRFHSGEKCLVVHGLESRGHGLKHSYAPDLFGCWA